MVWNCITKLVFWVFILFIGYLYVITLDTYPIDFYIYEHRR